MRRPGAPMWTCPRCGAKFVTTNLAHSCGLATLDDWLRKAGPRGRALYRKFERLVARCGPYDVAPARTRIAFMGRVRFAGITRLGPDGMTCGVTLPAPLESKRFVKVEEVAPGWWVHRLRVTDPSELDAQVARWIKRSYRWFGMQERLRTR